jgi:hypothetical protein
MIIIQGSKSTLSTFKKSGAKIMNNWIRSVAKNFKEKLSKQIY